MARIHYEGTDGAQTLERDVADFNPDGYVTAYNVQEEPGVADKVRIPTTRVIRVDGSDYTPSTN